MFPQIQVCKTVIAGTGLQPSVEWEKKLLILKSDLIE